jgi:hypothetical protein
MRLPIVLAAVLLLAPAAAAQPCPVPTLHLVLRDEAGAVVPAASFSETWYAPAGGDSLPPVEVQAADTVRLPGDSGRVVPAIRFRSRSCHLRVDSVMVRRGGRVMTLRMSIRLMTHGRGSARHVVVQAPDFGGGPYLLFSCPREPARLPAHLGRRSWARIVPGEPHRARACAAVRWTDAPGGDPHPQPIIEERAASPARG